MSLTSVSDVGTAAAVENSGPFLEFPSAVVHGHYITTAAPVGLLAPSPAAPHTGQTGGVSHGCGSARPVLSVYR